MKKKGAALRKRLQELVENQTIDGRALRKKLKDLLSQKGKLKRRRGAQ